MSASTTLKATDYTKVAAVLAGTASAGSFPDASKRKLHAMYDEFYHATAWDSGSVIGFGMLPKGARVLGWIVAWDAQGGSVTGDFEIGGVTASTSECITDMTSAGGLFIPALAVFQDTPLTTDSVLTVVTAGAAFGQTATDKLCITTLYLIED